VFKGGVLFGRRLLVVLAVLAGKSRKRPLGSREEDSSPRYAVPLPSPRTGNKTRMSHRNTAKSAVLTHLPMYTCPVPDTHPQARRRRRDCTPTGGSWEAYREYCAPCHGTQVGIVPCPALLLGGVLDG